MFRVSQFVRELVAPTPIGPRRDPPGPVVIWNLIRRCNLTCRHCYSVSADRDFPGELTTPEAFTVMDDLKAFRVPVLILSGGEPLLRPDVFDIAMRAKSLGLYVGLSTNGTLIDDSLVGRIAAVGFDYVGISLDGRRETHDAFRRRRGAFEDSLAAARACRDAGVKVGLRFTLTEGNAADLPYLLELADIERIDKFYLSHLNYAGRGNVHRKQDAYFATTRRALDLVFDAALRALERGAGAPPCGDATAEARRVPADQTRAPPPAPGSHLRPPGVGTAPPSAGAPEKEFVTGNNDADGPYFLMWASARFPERAEHLRAKLEQWGGNASGVNVANIDNLGNVHPDTYWWDYSLGNVRERPFSVIWQDLSEPILRGLRARPRTIKGRCAECRFFTICGGNTRTRARSLTGDPWAEDPGCYLDDDEIGATAGRERVKLTPYSRWRGAEAAAR
jgi:radical SAM protein with 4Fe4S-binding SPASM domain